MINFSFMEFPLTGQILDPVWFEPTWDTWDRAFEHFRSRFWYGTRFEFRQYTHGDLTLKYGGTAVREDGFHIDKLDQKLWVASNLAGTLTRDYGQMPTHHVHELTNVFHRWPDGSWPGRVLLRSLDTDLFMGNSLPPWMS